MAKEKDDRVVGDLSCKEQTSGLQALEDQGMQVAHFLRLKTDKIYAKKVAEYMMSGGKELPLDYKMVKAILHRNFLGLEEWQRHFGVKPTKRMLEAAANFPWSAEVLNSPCPFTNSDKVLVRDTHIAFLGLDIDDERRPLKPRRLADFYCMIGNVHFGIQPDRLTKQTCDLRWYLMPIHPQILTGSGDEWKKKMADLPEGYEQAYFIEELTKTMLLRAARFELKYHGGEISYGCKDELDHGKIAELVVKSPMPSSGSDLQLLPGWPAMRTDWPAETDIFQSPIRKLLAISVSRKLPS